MVIEGKNAILEALKADKTIDKLLLQQGKDSLGRIFALAREKGIKVQFVTGKVLDRTSESGNHQGCIAYISEFSYAEFDTLLEKKDSERFVIVCDGIQDVHNLGSIIRVAECAGATGVVIAKNNAAQVTSAVMRTSAGAVNHLPIARVTNINTAIEKLQQNGYWVYGLEADGENIYGVNLQGDIALVVGGEDKGLKALTRKTCDKILSIPLKGKITSLNASVALAVVSYEKVRQSEKL